VIRWAWAWLLYFLSDTGWTLDRRVRKAQKKLAKSEPYTGVRNYHYCDASSCCEVLKIKGARYCGEYCERKGKEQDAREEKKRLYQQEQAVRRQAEAAAFQLTQHDGATETKRSKAERMKFYDLDDEGNFTTTSKMP